MLSDVRKTLADRYTIEGEIGAGGMARVYGARDVRHDREVAVKVLRDELATTIGGERFLREIAIASRLQHPHILALIDSGIVDGIPYYVMPRIHGQSLRARLTSEGELPVSDGIQILRQVLDALVYAHGHGIIHRDIKPENILLSGYAPLTGRSSRRWHAMVTDFGIAKALSKAASHPTLTGSGVSIGTPACMSPEQAAGDPNVDHRADIYAVGVMAYEIFAGTPPFAASNPQQLIAAHIARTPEPLSRRRPSIPPELDRLILRCLQKQPADRWQTAEELLTHLDAIGAVNALHVAETETAAEPEIERGSYRLTERVCRKLDRATLDPRMIGAELQYADNNVRSDVLIVLLHGTGQDDRVFREIMTALPYRCIAPTLLGFEPEEQDRLVLPLATHIEIIRQFAADASAMVGAKAAILVGFSSGADIALVLASRSHGRPPIDGIVSLGSNLSSETCFVTRLWSQLGSDDEQGILKELQRFGAGPRTLEEWVKVQEYLVNTLRKFGSDVTAVRRFSEDIVRIFDQGDDETFATLFRNATQHVPALRCVWEDSDICVPLVQALRVRNLDTGILGDYYRDDALVIEPRADHFDLLDPELLRRHVDDVLGMVKGSGA